MVGVNLIPVDVQNTQRWRRHFSVWLALVLSAAALLVVPVVIGWVRQSEANRLEARNDELQSLLARRRAQVRFIEEQTEDVSLRLERANALKSKRAWSGVFASIEERMPKGCWLTSCATDPSAPAASGSPGRPRAAKKTGDSPEPDRKAIMLEAPRKLTLTGYATESAEPYQFVYNLKSAGLFSEVAMRTSRLEPALRGSYFRFELVCEW